MMSPNMPAILGGARTPFLDTAGAYSELMTHELGAKAIAGAVERSGIDPSIIEMVAMGVVLHEVETTNIAREAMLTAGLSSTIPAYTTSMAGLSPNVAVATLSDMIRLGRIDIAVAGGMENFSDVPIRLSRNIRRMAMKIRQARDGRQRLKALAAFRPSDLKLDIPTSSDFTTGQTMGQSTEATIRKYSVSRDASDQFALRSHQLAVQALSNGAAAQDIIPVSLANGITVSADNTPRSELCIEKLAGLKPVFDRENGIITAGNASRFTDGAASVLLGSVAAAEQHNLEVLALIVDVQFSGVPSLDTDMLLGPAMTIPKLLSKNGLTMDDISVFEVHEAFAAQVLANQQCLASNDFSREHLGLSSAPGSMPQERLNCWGGSLAFGNPFAATGIRLLLNATRRLQAEQGQYAIVSSCAGGGLGAAILLENPNFN